MSDWFARISPYISADSDAITRSLLKYQLPMYLWLHWELEGQQPSEVALRYLDGSNTQIVTIELATREQVIAVQEAQQASEEPTEELSEPRSFSLLDGGVAWLKPGPFYSFETPDNPWDPNDFIKFVEDAFAQIAQNDIHTLVVDVRDNPGGNNSFSDPLIARFANKPFRFAHRFVVRSSQQAQKSNQARIEQSGAAVAQVSKQLAEHFAATEYGDDFNFEIDWVQPVVKDRFSGQVIVLVNQHSYSNAVSLAAIVQDFEFGIVVGESTTDFATTYGAMETFTLPVSGLTVGFPKALIVRPSGDQTPGPVIVDYEIGQLATLSRAQIVDAIMQSLVRE